MSNSISLIKEGTITDLYGYDIVINEVMYPNTFEDDIGIDRTVLEDEFANQAGKYSYWSTLSALAKAQEAKLKWVSELVYATSDHNARMEARKLQEAGDTRKFTEKIYETMAKTNQEYQKAQRALQKAKELSSLLVAAEHAFAQRKEMLISLGAHARIGATDVKVLGAQVRGRVQKEQEIKEEIVDNGTREETTKTQETTRRRRRKARAVTER